ncbi:MAG: hypothetical protein JWP12_3400 [Bacteroidetes bacterium]|nr:hypothetical protein [Bacteroidota bacterium]
MTVKNKIVLLNKHSNHTDSYISIDWYLVDSQFSVYSFKRKQGMKRTFLLILFLALFFNASSQDSIVKKNGQTLIAKVLEIGTSEIKYKRNDIPDGPVYIELKSNIERISFANGVKEIFKDEPAAPVPVSPPVLSYYVIPQMNNKIENYGNMYTYHHNKISERQLYDMLNSTHDKKIKSLVDDAKNAKIAQYIGFGAIPFGILGYYYFLRGTGEADFGGQSNNSVNGSGIVAAGFCIAVAISCPIASGIFKFKKMKYNRAAIALYNEKF